MSYLSYVILAFTKAIPGSLAIFRFNKANLGLKAFIILLWFGIFQETLNLISTHVWGNSLLTGHHYTAIEFALITLFYHQYLLSVRSKWLIYIGLCFVPASLVYGYLVQDPFMFNSLARSIESALVLIYGWLWLKRDVRYQAGYRYRARSSVFWINTGIMFYFGTNLLTFALSNSMLKNNQEALLMSYIIHAFINAFVNLLFAFALWKNNFRS